MKDQSAIGPGLPSAVYPDLTDRLATAQRVPDPDLAFVLAVCSSYAYGDAGTVAAIMDRLGLTRNRCRLISEYVDALFLTSAAYLIQSHDGRVAILCYRGTPPTSLITWLTDFEVEPVTISVTGLPGAKKSSQVHGGFYRNVRSTRFRIIQLLQEAIAGRSILDPADNPDDVTPGNRLKVVYVTGHSLGGASAALFAALLTAEPSPYGGIGRDTYAAIEERLRAVYTYGSPMVGSPDFVVACNQVPLLTERVIRYVYANDVVPQVPPKGSGDFEHFGREYRYQRGTWTTPSRPRKQIRSLFQVAMAPLAVMSKSLTVTRRIRFRASLNDHLPQYYIDALAPEGLRSEFGE